MNRARPSEKVLSRRERQIMDILYARGSATAADILALLDDPPSYSGVRTILRVLTEKGHVVFDVRGNQYVYRPMVSAPVARQSALRHVIQTFFGGRPEQVLSHLLSKEEMQLTQEEAEKLQELINASRRRS